MGKSENAKISFGSTTRVAPRGLYQFKKVYTDYNAEQEKGKLIHLKYYIRGRWMIERRKECLGPITGRERRKIA